MLDLVYVIRQRPKTFQKFSGRTEFGCRQVLGKDMTELIHAWQIVEE